jgi:uncharacterized OB-fold protein
MDNVCSKCGKEIFDDSEKCDACKRTFGNFLKKVGKGAVVVVGVAIAVVLPIIVGQKNKS